MSFFSDLLKEVSRSKPPTSEDRRSPGNTKEGNTSQSNRSTNSAKREDGSSRSPSCQPVSQKRCHRDRTKEQPRKMRKLGTPSEPKCPPGNPRKNTDQEDDRKPAHSSTPPSYAHGPRGGHSDDPLIDYATHAAILRGKLQALVRDKDELEKACRSAADMHKTASVRLREHNADQAHYLNRRGGSMEEWQSVKAGILRSLEKSKAKVEQMKREAETRRLRLDIDGLD